MGMNKALELAANATIVGTYNCQGEVPQQILDSAENKDPKPAWLQDAYNAKGHPDEEDIYKMCVALEKAGVVESPKKGEKRMFS
jgi:hypothetical protein